MAEVADRATAFDEPIAVTIGAAHSGPYAPPPSNCLAVAYAGPARRMAVALANLVEPTTT